jgi:hypothetical protein
MSRSLIRKNQLHPDINDLVGQYGSGYFTSINNLVATGQVLQNQLNTAVYITGNQTINGIKTFIDRPIFNGTGVATLGDLTQNINNGDGLVNTTYSVLTGLKATSQLIPGNYYRISDFHLMWWNQSVNDTTVKSGLSPEPLIVLALSGNKISHEAKSELYPQDTVYYDIDATSSNSWGTINNNSAIPGFKGWIYRRVDNKLNIDIPWDWRHITVNCCRPDMSSIGLYNAATTYGLYSVVKNASNKLYYSIQNNNTNRSLINTSWWLPVSDFIEGDTYFVTNETYGFRSYNIDPMTAFVNLPANTGTRIQQPTFTSSLVSQGTFQLTNCNNIKIENGYSNLFLGDGARDNIIGNNFSYNTIGNYFGSNTIGNGFRFNTIGDNFLNNAIGNSFFSNTIGNYFEDNTIGNYFGSNTIGIEFSRNTIGNYFRNNAIGNYFNFNTIGNGFSSNTIGDEFVSNAIGNYFNTNNIKEDFKTNIIGHSFESNTIGEDFSYNTIGNGFIANTIKDEFDSNIIGNGFNYNTIGNGFDSNTIGNSFYSNTIGNSFRRNTVENNINIGNVTGATHIYNNYNTRIFSNSNNIVRLSYFNASDQLVVTDPTA